MPGLEEWRVRVGEQRESLRVAEDDLARTRLELADADAALADALRVGDLGEAARVEEQRRAAEEAHLDAVRRKELLRDGVTDRLRDVLDRLGERLGTDREVALEGVEDVVVVATQFTHWPP